MVAAGGLRRHRQGGDVGADLSVERKLPQNLEAERSVLGAILLDNDAFHVAVRFIESKDFFLKEHRKIFARMARMLEQRQAVDLVTLNDELERAGELEAAGGTAYLSSLVDGVPRISHVEHYARIVQEKALLRQLAHVGNDILGQVLEGRKSSATIVQAADASLKMVSAHPRKEVWAETKLSFRTGAELAAEAPGAVEWVAPPWVARGCITELAGKVKTAGKTTFVTHLVRAVLEGAPFLGQGTSKTAVVFLTEQPPASFHVAMSRAGLVGRDDFVVLHWNTTVGLSWEIVACSALRECGERGARLLVVDSLSQFAGLVGDAENNAGDALLAMQPLQKGAAEGLGVIVVRPERKSGGLVGDSGRGSSAFAGAVDTLISLRRPEGNHRPTLRILQAISRFNDMPDQLMIELTPAGYLSLGCSADVAALEAQKTILAAAPHSEEDAVKLNDLLEGSQITRATAQRAVKGLLAAGKLARTGSGKRGKAFRFFKAEKVSAQTSSLNGQKETETISAGLEAGRRAGFWGNPVKKPDKPDGSGEVEV